MQFHSEVRRPSIADLESSECGRAARTGDVRFLWERESHGCASLDADAAIRVGPSMGEFEMHSSDLPAPRTVE